MAENETLQEQQPAAVDTAAAQENQPAGGSSEKLYSDTYVKARIDKQNKKHAEELAERDERIAELEKQANEASAKAAELEREKERNGWIAAASKETGLPIDAVSRLSGDTAEQIMENAKAISGQIPQQRRFSETPNGGVPAGNAGGAYSREDIRKIKDPAERMRLAAENAKLLGVK